MHSALSKINTKVYDKCSLKISNFITEIESKEYYACRFKLNERQVICRDAKITPKKVGQFVTFWKRVENQPIEPFQETDLIAFFVVNVKQNNKMGQFVFPKFVLLQKGIISTKKKDGKRAFRVYPIWDTPTSEQAKKSQKWQLNYFYEIDAEINLKKVMELYKIIE